MSKPLKTTNKRIIKMLEKMRDKQAQSKDKAKIRQRQSNEAFTRHRASGGYFYNLFSYRLFYPHASDLQAL